MAKMFFSVKVAIDKCTELESKLNCVRPAKITKRRRSEYTPIQSAAKRSRSNSEPQIDLSSSYFEDDGLDLVSNEATETSKCKRPIYRNQSEFVQYRYQNIICSKLFISANHIN